MTSTKKDQIAEAVASISIDASGTASAALAQITNAAIPLADVIDHAGLRYMWTAMVEHPVPATAYLVAETLEATYCDEMKSRPVDYSDDTQREAMYRRHDAAEALMELSTLARIIGESIHLSLDADEIAELLERMS